MDETEFRRLIELFPVVRPRDYQVESQTSQNLQASQPLNEKNEGDETDAFWDKLKMSAEQKVGTEEAEKFCKTFQQIYRKLVYEGLSSDVARTFLNS